MTTEAEISRALRRLRRELDGVERRRERLYAERLIHWRAARALGISTSDLADLSGVSPVTVRQLIRRGEG